MMEDLELFISFGRWFCGLETRGLELLDVAWGGGGEWELEDSGEYVLRIGTSRALTSGGDCLLEREFNGCSKYDAFPPRDLLD